MFQVIFIPQSHGAKEYRLQLNYNLSSIQAVELFVLNVPKHQLARSTKRNKMNSTIRLEVTFSEHLEPVIRGSEVPVEVVFRDENVTPGVTFQRRHYNGIVISPVIKSRLPYTCLKAGKTCV